MARRLVLGLLLSVLIIAALFAAVSWRTEIAPVEPAPRTAFDAALVARGASLAAIGDCTACHTPPGGKAYAGGYPLKTPFGTIYGTNITPDPETGIGRWPQTAFVRAMREGVDRQGRHLYPAFPYNHFTLASDEDLQALYAFFMTREPVRTEEPPNELRFPFNIRMLLAGWKMLFFDEQRFRPDPAQSAEWNRGAYLSLGLGHCGACHTPRNALGAEKNKQFFAGGEAEGWHAPALNGSSPAPVPWTAESLLRYLRHGASDTHDVAVGPMALIVHSMANVPEQEVRAIATYVASLMEANPERQQRAEQALARARGAPPDPQAEKGARQASQDKVDIGAVVYSSTCAGCHAQTRRPPGAPSSDALHLALSTSVTAPTPRNLIRVIVQGMSPPDGEPGPLMPGFAAILTDDQLAALVTYVRAAYSGQPAWNDVEREVREARKL
ncbi:MAG TPA: cytochrome c [Burkholderiales bacterium]|nr:cytochrome c [Burkholderiales bacterium]